MSRDFNYEHIESYLIGAIDDYGDDRYFDDDDNSEIGVKGWEKLNALTREQCFELVQSFARAFFNIKTGAEDAALPYDDYFHLHCEKKNEGDNI